MKTNRFGLFATSVILVVSTLLFSVHWLLDNASIFPPTYAHAPWRLSYLLLIPLSLFSFWFVFLKFQKDPTSAGKSFFIVVFVKIFASLYFLFPGGPVVTHQNAREMALQYMVPFLVLLFIETYLLIKLLNTGFAEKLKNDENQ